LLPGSKLQLGLQRQVLAKWNIDVAPIALKDYGWGFVKLEPLFFDYKHKFLVLDSDTAFSGPVLNRLISQSDFIVDKDEPGTGSCVEDFFSLELKSRLFSSDFRLRLFNSGQWVGTSGILSRDDFSPWLSWSYPRRLKRPELFYPGDQGVLNLVTNQAYYHGRLSLEQIDLMLWPPNHVHLCETTPGNLSLTPACIIHWAGIKSNRLNRMPMSKWLVNNLSYFYLSSLRIRKLFDHSINIISQALILVASKIRSRQE
jgi:hypothetical protein